MPVEDVVALLTALERAGVRCWLDGGWGVDALLGRQTRPHNDLDLAVVTSDLAEAQQVLEAHGFHVLRDWLPTALAVRDGEGREVDLHPVEATADGGGDQVLQDGSRYHYSAPVLARIDGRTVACAPVEGQIEMHLGYEPRDTDHVDMRALAAAYDFVLPPPYGGTSG